jgi:hypothetical protein
MKKFLTENWYKLMIGSSMVMASFGFMVYAISPAMDSNNDLQLSDGTVSVRLSDEQLDKIIPKNEDGSVKVSLSREQLDKLTAIQDVDIKKLNGYSVLQSMGSLPVRIIP